MVVTRILAVCLLVLTLSGCVSEKEVFRIAAFPEQSDGALPVWPESDEVPRYVYVGDLTGESNFAGEGPESDAQGLIAWLVGLGRVVREPVVLRRPQGVAEGVDGRVWVSDVSRQAVFLFDPKAGELQVFSKVDGHRQFVAPVGLAPLPDGGVMVADAELGVVVELSPDGEPRRVIGEGLLERPTGLAFDAARSMLYVADTRANRISVLDAEGKVLYAIGKEGDAEGGLNAPTYIALDGDRLYVTDTLNARIQVFDNRGDYIKQLSERGLYIGNLTRPKGISISDEGFVYVVESFYDHLLIFDKQGRLLLPIGGTGRRPGQFYLPSGVWAGSNGRVYVADMFNGRVAVLQFLGEGL